MLLASLWVCSSALVLLYAWQVLWSSKIANTTVGTLSTVSRCGNGVGSRGIGLILLAPLREGWLAVLFGCGCLGGLCN